MASGLPLDSLFAYLWGGRYTSLNANPTVFTGPAFDMSAANATAAGDVVVTTQPCTAGQYIPILTVHTALLYATSVDNAPAVKRVRTVDAAGAAAEGTVSFFGLMRIATV